MAVRENGPDALSYLQRDMALVHLSSRKLSAVKKCSAELQGRTEWLTENFGKADALNESVIGTKMHHSSQW
jgi:hypothetical protein